MTVILEPAPGARAPIMELMLVPQPAPHWVVGVIHDGAEEAGLRVAV